MAVQSLLVIAQYKLNINVIIINNASLGMITQFQHLYFDNRMFGTTEAGGFINPNLKLLAHAYGLNYIEATDSSLERTDNLDQGPVVVNYRVSGLTTVCPKLEYNKPIDLPSPQLPELEYQTAMKQVDNQTLTRGEGNAF
jgi:acetolactate synthase-1/2/3 large subunit